MRNASNDLRGIGQALKFSSEYGEPTYFQTHKRVIARPKALILQTRNVFDYCVSSYFFHYKNRIRRKDVDVDDVLPRIVERFVKTHLDQKRAAENADSSYILRYEDIQKDTFGEYAKVLRAIDEDFSEIALWTAIEKSSSENLVQFEKRVGHAAVAKRGTFAQQSFIRSGKIGEGQDFFSKLQLSFIQNICDRSAVPTNGNIIIK